MFSVNELALKHQFPGQPDIANPPKHLWLADGDWQAAKVHCSVYLISSPWSTNRPLISLATTTHYFQLEVWERFRLNGCLHVSTHPRAKGDVTSVGVDICSVIFKLRVYGLC